jgi:hypothetical protein
MEIEVKERPKINLGEVPAGKVVLYDDEYWLVAGEVEEPGWVTLVRLRDGRREEVQPIAEVQLKTGQFHPNGEGHPMPGYALYGGSVVLYKGGRYLISRSRKPIALYTIERNTVQTHYLTEEGEFWVLPYKFCPDDPE